MKINISAVLLLLGLSIATVSCGGSHKYVDLGLPSGTMWATCNVGASTPEGYGDYFAWGELTPKQRYDWDTSKWYNGGPIISLTKYITYYMYGFVDNKTTLDLSDDVAHGIWGGNWRMPTDAEWRELQNICTWTWTSRAGRHGYKVTSKKNGNSIFLPAAGCRDDTSIENKGSFGHYWSSSLRDNNIDRSAKCVYFSPTLMEWKSSDRCYGLSVRPVCRPSTATAIGLDAEPSAKGFLIVNGRKVFVK